MILFVKFLVIPLVFVISQQVANQIMALVSWSTFWAKGGGNLLQLGWSGSLVNAWLKELYMWKVLSTCHLCQLLVLSYVMGMLTCIWWVKLLLQVYDDRLFIHPMSNLKECGFFWLIYMICGILLLSLSNNWKFFGRHVSTLHASLDQW